MYKSDLKYIYIFFDALRDVKKNSFFIFMYEICMKNVRKQNLGIPFQIQDFFLILAY